MFRQNPKSWLSGVALALGAFLLTLACVEAALRIFYPGIGALRSIITAPPGGDSRAYVLKPGARTSFQGLHQKLVQPVTWAINSDGIRAEESDGRQTGAFRIATFGDSETFGWSVAIGDTFQKRMEESDQQVEVINFGVPGYNIENVADEMAARLSSEKADMVVYLFHKNDLDGRITFSRLLSQSYFYLLLRKSQARLFRILRRDKKGSSLSPERIGRLTQGVNRMLDLARRENLPFLIGLFDERYREHLPAETRHGCEPQADRYPCQFRTGAFSAGSLDLARNLGKAARSVTAPFKTGDDAMAMITQGKADTMPHIAGHQDRNCS